MTSADRAFDALLRCVERFREAELPFMVVGALAVSVHGRPRSTHDIVLHMPFSDRDEVRPIVEELADAAVEERRDPQWGQRLVTALPSGLELEVFFIHGHPLYRREYERRLEIEVEGQPIPFISPEDLVLWKLVNTKLRRGEDLQDARSVARVQGQNLDVAYLREHCAPPPRVREGRADRRARRRCPRVSSSRPRAGPKLPCARPSQASNVRGPRTHSLLKPGNIEGKRPAGRRARPVAHPKGARCE